MAVALDNDLGSAGGSLASSTTWDLVTTSAASPESLVILKIGGYANFAGGVASVSGGGLTWTIDVDYSGFLFGAIASAPAPSGLSSSTTITVTLDSAMGPCMISGASYSGVDTGTSRLADSDSATADTTASWAAPSLITTAGDLVVGACFASGDGTHTSTPGIGTELHDFTSNGQDEFTSLYATATGTSTVPAGTWSGVPGTMVSVGAAYLQGEGGADEPSGSLQLLGIG